MEPFEISTRFLAEHNATALATTRAKDAYLLAQYAKLRTPAPPIIMENEITIEDGIHRLAVALDRGDETILAVYSKRFKKDA